MLDCHIIVSPFTPRAWVSQCLRSIYDAMDRAGFPVKLHMAPFFPEHIGQSRAAGYAMGSHPYVTCVDDDDWLEPNAFACLADAMASGAPAIYTREFQHQNGHQRETNLRQHLRVFRRDVVTGFDFSPWPALDSTALIAHADRYGPAIDLRDRVYHYRVRPDSHAKRLLTAHRATMPALPAAVHEVTCG